MKETIETWVWMLLYAGGIDRMLTFYHSNQARTYTRSQAHMHSKVLDKASCPPFFMHSCLKQVEWSSREK